MMDMATEIISDLELEHIINSLRGCGLDDVGGKEWVEQMSMLEELNVQSALEAERGEEERVRDALVERDKMPLVVREAALIELWREEVMPRILKMGEPETCFQFYMTIFNECNIVNLLETTLFHAAAVESLGDAAVDLADYCVRQMTAITVEEGGGANDAEDERKWNSFVEAAEEWTPGTSLPVPESEDALTELKRHTSTTRFQVAMKCISIARYLSDNLEELPLSVTTRLVVTHDLPALLIWYLENRPWLREGPKGRPDRVFQGADWVDLVDGGAVQKLEGQTWIALYNLLSKPQSAEKYSVNEYRRSILLRLLGRINDNVINQLSFLGGFKRWLLNLQMGSVPPSKPSGLFIEAFAEIRDGLVKSYSKEYDSIAKRQAPIYLGHNKDVFQDEMSKLIATFDKEPVQAFLSDKRQQANLIGADRTCCVVCRQPNAKNRCSRCRSERYCGRECQVKHWPSHKGACSEKKRAEEEREKDGARITEIIE